MTGVPEHAAAPSAAEPGEPSGVPPAAGTVPPDPLEGTVGAGPEPVAEEELTRLAAERDGYLDDLRRVKAEFDNYRRRAERDREAMARAGVRELVSELLPVIDNLERALLASAGAPNAVVEGVEMVRAQLATLLSGRGVAEIAAEAAPFDPNVHEAVGQVASADHPEGTVVAVVQKGYLVDDMVARPARVIVAGPPPEEPAEA